ncbi:MAG: winged helix-turn-helix domain-containing protein [Ardenticatenaceae bacterium]
MRVWSTYPVDYRAAEVQAIMAAVRAGECVSVVGLSGAGKSNVLGFVANRVSTDDHPMILVDGNRLRKQTPDALFRLIRRGLGNREKASDEWEALDMAIEERLDESSAGRLTILLDRIDELAAQPGYICLNNLRALRDLYKYQLTFITGTRRPLPAESEFSELVLANTIWLGPMSPSDSRWNVARYAARKGLVWDDQVADALIDLSKGYPSFLRAACEAYANGAELKELASHPILQARLDEFLSDQPTAEHLKKAGLFNHPLLSSISKGSKGSQASQANKGPSIIDEAALTPKEHLLLDHFRQHAGEVSDKETLIRAVWPEDQIYQQGVRDDSLAQLVRRLRQKIEPDPSNPRFIETVRGRGYRFFSE